LCFKMFKLIPMTLFFDLQYYPLLRQLPMQRNNTVHTLWNHLSPSTLHGILGLNSGYQGHAGNTFAH
ncbi:hypothetical protein ACQP3F_32330, partial [Escherichia coli]